jgi:hypothetical protein
MNIIPGFVADVPARSSLAARYAQVRQASLDLAAPLSPEDCQVQSMADASPTKGRRKSKSLCGGKIQHRGSIQFTESFLCEGDRRTDQITERNRASRPR